MIQADASPSAWDQMVQRMADLVGHAARPDASVHPLVYADRDVRVARCREDPVLFAQVYLPNWVPALTAEFHRAMLAVAARAAAVAHGGAIIAAPRGHAKSTWLSFVYPLHALLYGTKRCIVLISNTHYLSTSLVRNMRLELEQNDLLRADFGPMQGAKWADSAFETYTDSKVTARSIGSQLRGTKHREYRPDLIICDDMEKDDHVRTEDQRHKYLDWFNKVVLPSMNPHTGTLLVVGTILHFDSLLSNLLKLDDVYETCIFRTTPETPLWPEMYNGAWLTQERRRIGPLAFASEYENNPLDAAAQVFKPAWWRWYSKDEVAWDEAHRGWVWRDQPLLIYQGVDPAISDEDSADYFAHLTIGMTPNHDILILDAIHDRLGFDAQLDLIIELHRRWEPRKCGVETNAYQLALVQGLLRRDPTLRLEPIVSGGRSPDIDPTGLYPEERRGMRAQVAPRTTKFMRIKSRSPLAANGQLWLREAKADEAHRVFPELPERRVHAKFTAFFEQAIQYPKSAHDDLLDALDHALVAAERGGHGWSEGGWIA